MSLQLFCEAPGCWHPVEGGRYDLPCLHLLYGSVSELLDEPTHGEGPDLTGGGDEDLDLEDRLMKSEIQTSVGTISCVWAQTDFRGILVTC